MGDIPIADFGHTCNIHIVAQVVEFNLDGYWIALYALNKMVIILALLLRKAAHRRCIYSASSSTITVWLA